MCNWGLALKYALALHIQGSDAEDLMQPGSTPKLRLSKKKKKNCETEKLHIYLQPISFLMKNRSMRRDVFQAIADPTRRAILLLVTSQSMTAGAIASNFDTARPTVSKHLQILTECELLKQEQNGREIYYHLNAKKMKEVANFIEPFRQMWEDRFNKLETLMKNHKKK